MRERLRSALMRGDAASSLDSVSACSGSEFTCHVCKNGTPTNMRPRRAFLSLSPLDYSVRSQRQRAAASKGISVRAAVGMRADTAGSQPSRCLAVLQLRGRTHSMLARVEVSAITHKQGAQYRQQFTFKGSKHECWVRCRCCQRVICMSRV
jgi:hypothetical protein